MRNDFHHISPLLQSILFMRNDFHSISLPVSERTIFYAILSHPPASGHDFREATSTSPPLTKRHMTFMRNYLFLTFNYKT